MNVPAMRSTVRSMPISSNGCRPRHDGERDCSRPARTVLAAGHAIEGRFQDMRWARNRRLPIAMVAGLAVALSVAVALRLLGLDKAALWATILAPIVPVIIPITQWALQVRYTSQSTADQVQHAADELRSRVLEQWRKEAALRQLVYPDPLPVRWASVAMPLADHVIGGGIVSARSDKIEELVDTFLSMPHRRLVVLGEPGSGKSALAILFTLALCKRHNGTHLVPVLLSANSWDAEREPLEAWVIRFLDDNYSDLRSDRSYGSTALSRLVATGRVVTVLDGLDELPEDRRSEAIPAINRALNSDLGLIILCRTDEYRVAVHMAKDIIKTAAVIEAQPIDVNDVIAFLRRDISAMQKQRWQPVFDTLQRAPHGALATALASPLMVSIVRVVYANPDSDPGELVRLSDHAAIDDYLLGSFLKALIRDRVPKYDDKGVLVKPSWRPTRYANWIRFIAVHLDALHTRDLAWWELHKGTPPAMRVIALFVAGGVLFGSAPFLVSLLIATITASLATAAFGGVAFLVAGALSTLIVGGIGAVMRDQQAGWLPPIGHAVHLAGARSTLQNDYSATLRSLCIPQFLGILCCGLAYSLTFQQLPGPVAILIIVLALGSVAAMSTMLVVILSDHTCILYSISHAWLAVLGRVPWRLMDFLDDGHELGIFRQVGSVYQFRHARLQDHLVLTSMPSERDH